MLDTTKMEARRKELGISQVEAASRAGLTARQAWNNIETGKRVNITLETLTRIAEALECDPRELIKTPSVST
jgi:transcriptional regulator with XRE-family HTH domain